MSGFVRRFTSFPSNDVLTAIEGINIIDLPPPSAPNGVQTNTVALVGEFVDMTYALTMTTGGVFSTRTQPVEIFSGQDLLNKVGGFDETIGQFGGDCGNGYAELRNKSFGHLVVVPVNLASATGVRLFRELPTNRSATDPTPVVPMSAAVVNAGYNFKNGLDRLKTVAPVNFTGADAYTSGTDGTVSVAASAATQTFGSASGAFTTFTREDGTVGVQVGDILVVGVIGLTGLQGDDAGTYRVVSITSATVIVVQALNAANFAWTTAGVILAWRLHTGATADSYGSGTGSVSSSQGSFSVPVRPLTDGAGTGSGAANGTWATGLALTPVVAPAALTANSADPLSGLMGKVGPTTAVAYTAAVQKANVENSATVDALYSTAIDAMLLDSETTAAVTHIWAARKSSTIRTKLKTHCLAASENGFGRTCSISPELDQTYATVFATVTGTAAPGVGATRDERLFYDWPPVKTIIPEAAGKAIMGADGVVHYDAIVDTTGDGWMASIMGNLEAFRNPGESSPTTSKVLAPVIGYARNVPDLSLNEWKQLRASGIAGIRMDRTVGPVFQSGITSSLVAGRKNIARRKMADYIQDSLGSTCKPFVKLPMSDTLKDGVLGQITDFLELLLSENNPAAQQISGFVVDALSGNTPQSEAAGIFVVIAKVRTLASADFITIQTDIGEGVITTKDISA